MFSSPDVPYWLPVSGVDGISFNKLSSPPFAYVDKGILYELDDGVLYYNGNALSGGGGGIAHPDTSVVGQVALFDNTTGDSITTSKMVVSEPEEGIINIDSGDFCKVRISLKDDDIGDPGLQHVVISNSPGDNRYAVAIGVNSMLNNVSGISDVAIGGYALWKYTGAGGSGSNIAMGYNSAPLMETGTYNTLLGANCCAGTLYSERNTIVGFSAGAAISSGLRNVIIGSESASSFSGSCNENIIIGHNAARSNVNSCIRIGEDQSDFKVGNVVDINGFTTAIGLNALRNVATSYNIAVGNYACNQLGAYAGNVAVGTNNLRYGTSYSNCTAIGQGTLTNCTGNSNTALGYSVLTNLLGGTDNIGIGQLAGSTYTTTESGNIMVGNVGVIGESNVIRVGTSQTKTFIAGVRGITTVNANAIPVVVDSAGQLGTVSSSRKYKKNIEPITDSEIIYSLKAVSFDYKEQAEGFKHIGLIAEEVEEVYPEMVVYQDDEILTVDYQRLSILLLHQVQQLKKMISNL